MSFRPVLLFFVIVLAPAGSLGAAQLPASSPTGILVDRVLPVAELRSMDGTPFATEVSLARWRQAVFELQRSAEYDLGWPAPRALAEAERARVDWNTVPLGLLHARYDEMEGPSAMRTGEVFAFAPLRQKSFHGDRVIFTIDASAILAHGAAEIAALSLDAGDGSGFRPLPVGGLLEVGYATMGFKNLALRAELADGRRLESFSSLEVVRGVTPDPTDTWAITATQTWEGVAGTGQAYLYLAEGRTELANPVVVVEGFDIDNTIDWPALYDLLNRENLLEDLRAAGFDAVVLDFTDAVEPIQRNAFVLTRLLELVAAATPDGQSAALVGASMGGLVSRYGLLWMQQQAIAHDVRNFISFDAPHQGANIPLGIQNWVSFFAGESEDAAFFLERLNSAAARQMLLYHLGSVDGTTANADPQMAALESEFMAMGEWPPVPRVVSIVNGSGAMAGQGFAAGDQIIQWEYSSLLVDIVGNVWAVPDGGSQVIFDGLIDQIFPLPDSSEKLTIDGTLPWDNAPGGSRPTMDQLADATAPFGDIIALHGSHCFIPTISALALATGDPFYDVAGDPDLLDHTAFVQVYYPAANQEHIEITAESKAWFMAEIQSGIAVSPVSGDTTEAGGTATFMVAAMSAPAADVTIGLSSSDPGEGTAPASVVLPAGSTEPQVVTVTGADDDIADGSVAYSIVTATAVSADPAYHGTDPADIALINLDDEPDSIFENGFEL